MEGIQQRIRRIIAERSLIQKDVAEKSGFTQMQFCDMLSGRKVIKAEYIPSIATAIGVPISDLFEETEDSDAVFIPVYFKGMDEALEKTNQLIKKLKEANSLADELASKTDRVIKM